MSFALNPAQDAEGLFAPSVDQSFAQSEAHRTAAALAAVLAEFPDFLRTEDMSNFIPPNRVLGSRPRAAPGIAPYAAAGCYPISGGCRA